MFDRLTGVVFEIKLHSTKLCTLAAIGTATETILRGITYARVTHAEGPVNKDFKLYIRYGTPDIGYLFSRQFTR